MNQRVLIADDERAMGEMLTEMLGRRGMDCIWKPSAAAALEALDVHDFDAVVTDVKMTGMHGIDLCARVVERRPDTPVIVITAFGSMETAVAAMRAGAYDFVTKPLEIDALELALRRAFERRALRNEVKRLRRAVRDAESFDEMVGTSPPMQQLFALLGRVAESDASVLVRGESGTGKELVARALHRKGKRASGPFIAINCSAVPEPLLESELFGHAAGAFTDAKTARDGLFVQANGGTLFLDEVGDLPLALQPKLLRALQERAVRPVGSTSEVSFTVRLIAATHRDLEADVEAGRFRQDLFYRIHVVPVDVPPLRARGNDVLTLAQRFVEECAAQAGRTISGITGGAAEKLLAYDWPGNVRELRNCIERAVALTAFEQVTVDDLPPRVREHARARVLIAADDPTEFVSMQEVERRYILRVLEALQGNKTSAARILGLDRKTLYRKLERWGV